MVTTKLFDQQLMIYLVKRFGEIEVDCIGVSLIA